MELCINVEIDGITTHLNMSTSQIQKMIVLFNAIEDGWDIKKQGDSYILTKLHEQKTEYFSDNYLKNFINTYFTIQNN